MRRQTIVSGGPATGLVFLLDITHTIGLVRDPSPGGVEISGIISASKLETRRETGGRVERRVGAGGGGGWIGFTMNAGAMPDRRWSRLLIHVPLADR